MKILYVHTLYEQSGGEDQVFENESALLSSGNDVKQLLFNNAGNKLSVLFKFLLAPYNPFSISRFKRVLREETPDIIHLHNWHFSASPALITAAKKANIPVVVTIHNYRLLCPSATLFHEGQLFEESLKFGFPWTAVARKVYRNSSLQTFWLACTVALHKKLKTWQQVDLFITLTPFARQLHLASGLKLREDQLKVKPNFVEDHGFSTETREKYFLFVGRLCVEKGIHHLIEAFEHTDHRLVIAGDGPLREIVEQAAEKNPNLRYLGKKSRVEVMSLMKRASALIFPSIWYEGMPMTILESFSTGTPVIACRMGAMESLIQEQENGLLYTPADPEALKKSLQAWVNLGAACKSAVASNARNSYEHHYTPEANLSQILSIYNSLIEVKQTS
jgi:glycosyltransferase involved in cell wall biosynthesis